MKKLVVVIGMIAALIAPLAVVSNEIGRAHV